jgi:hypothetical protein
MNNIHHISISNEQKVIIGKGWYKNFIRRNKEKIKWQTLKAKD